MWRLNLHRVIPILVSAIIGLIAYLAPGVLLAGEARPQSVLVLDQFFCASFDSKTVLAATSHHLFGEPQFQPVWRTSG